jgi:hypothetical protein
LVMGWASVHAQLPEAQPATDEAAPSLLDSANGRHLDRQVDELPADLVPLSPPATRAFAADPKPAQPAETDPQAPVVLNADDAPAAIVEVRGIRGATGLPVAMHVVVESKLPEPAHIKVDVLSFTAKGGLRSQSFMSNVRPVPPLGTTSVNILVNSLSATRDWRYVVAIQQVSSPARQWVNDHIRQDAEATLKAR